MIRLLGMDRKGPKDIIIFVISALAIIAAFLRLHLRIL
ncbi:hypothetical protein J2S17_003301 [Cytobacillus purgationiresistens]|uniref:Preprotein translocase subunit Sec61beta n=1 Tax=Cytobacillus purgationiresistens TaxID=863449 RepID=A0ABU0AM04_9BACI|nr:hypothetical protein [Cytobacillus purgationiresistens]